MRVLRTGSGTPFDTGSTPAGVRKMVSDRSGKEADRAMTLPRLIGLDWGTSSFRAYLMAGDGAVIDTVDAPSGIMHVEPGAHEATLVSFIGAWIADHGPLPVIASGMITSRQGWVETPYLGTPAGAAELAAKLMPHALRSGATLHFVPGLLTEDAAGAPDVMRGEETEIVGCAGSGDASGLFVMPGTHSKWVRVESGRIEAFTTYMTGEVFGALRDHTILGKLMERGQHPGDCDAFRQGVSASLDPLGGEALLHTLFSARTLPLTDRMSDDVVADYLSGLIIGHELRSGLRSGMAENGAVVLVGRGTLAERYKMALEIAGKASRQASERMAARGLHMIAQEAGVIDD